VYKIVTIGVPMETMNKQLK